MGIIYDAQRTLFQYIITRKCRQINSVGAERIRLDSQDSAVRAFHRACKNSPAYVKLIQAAGLRPERIRSFADFTAEVPITDKNTWFAKFDPAILFPEIRTAPTGRIWSSSGSSGTFSFGFEAPSRLAKSAGTMDFMLEYVYGILSKKTLFISCLPNPWPVLSNYAHFAPVGARTDVAVAILKKMSGVYDQFILGGEPLLLKKLLEDAVASNVALKKMEIHLITGGEYLAENLRRYYLQLLRDDTKSPRAKRANSALLTLGLSEFGTGVFFELPPLSEVRAHLAKSPSVFSEQFGGSTYFCPQIFQYNPYSLFVETPVGPDGNRHILLTDLSPDAPFPFVRYDTGDLGNWISHSDFRAFAQTHFPHVDLSELFPFPFISADGRRTGLSVQAEPFFDTNEAKEILFSIPTLTPYFTGCFQLKSNFDEPQASMLIQLKPAFHPEMLPEGDYRALERALKTRGIKPITIPYLQFPTSMELAYDRKFEYV